ncbi:MAG: hypothetical protein CVU61_15425 [Deltaproteobacteria bacterium HGW-Deltaproteobacteria-19]|jgi:thiol:disulfide interchange protein DsbD|nr:MAG: hypothetical protein CVU61_15425 [Deltaproteobacteria bacterium HGW-Deltaproteobacteria-19]
MIEQIQHLMEQAFRQGSITVFFFVFAGGVLASLTPCTYPVLPLTIGYIGNQAGASRWRVFLLSLSIVIGMAIVYAVMGAIVAAVGGTFGSIMGNGWILYGIALYFLLMGLFLLDVFYFPTPRFLAGLQAKSADRKGIPGALMLGGVSGLIVGPCTGPILAVALGTIALTLQKAQGLEYALQIVKGGALLFLFGLGQGALILVAGMFTGFLVMLPRAGAWMVAIQKGFAFLIILASTLLFVFVGQHTDFPSLTGLLAGSGAVAVPEPAGPASPAVIPEAAPVEKAGTALPQVSERRDAVAQSEAPEKRARQEGAARSVPASGLPAKTETPPRGDAASPTGPMTAARPAGPESAPTAASPAAPPRQHQAIAPPAPGAAEPPAPSERTGVRKGLAGKPAPDFTLSTLTGSRLTLSSYRGRKGVVLVFFATWCVTCMKEVPDVIRLHESAKNDDVVVLAVNYKQFEEVIERSKRSMGMTYEILLDRDGKVTEQLYGISGLPHVVGIDAGGAIVYRGSHIPRDQAEFIRSLRPAR